MSKTFLDKNNNVLVSVYETKEIVANPTLVGDEEEFTGLQVGNKKYAAPQGTPVVANPVLEGDEQALEGLEVKGTKYKVSGGSGSAQHYHKVVLATENQEQYCFGENLLLDVYIDTPGSLTVKDIWDYIRNKTYPEYRQVLVQNNYGNFGGFFYDACDLTDPLFDAGGISVVDFLGQYTQQQLLSTQVSIVYDEYI